MSDQPGSRPSRSPDTGGLQPGGGTGLAPNVAGALSYVVGVLTGILFLLLDRDRPYVRFHAAQAIVFSLAWGVVWIGTVVLDVILGAIPVLGWLLSLLLTAGLALGGFALWLYVMFRAYQGDEWEMPLIGPYARKLAREATD